MLQAAEFISACSTRGFTFFSGVPCSFLKPLINYVIQSGELDYITATSEGEAVGIASGAYLTSRRAVVICQNSGLGNMVNPLTSLNFPFRIPLLLIVTLRGDIDLKDEPQHELMGQITEDLLDTLHIPWEYFPTESKKIEPAFERAQAAMELSNLPYALVVKKGSVNETSLATVDTPGATLRRTIPEGNFLCATGERLSRMDTIRLIKEAIPDNTVLVASTGKIGRELFTIKDTANQLYVVGSMGCAAGIGFGIQNSRPQQSVIVLDGDGATLMKMGTIATIGYYQPARFVHIILDNEIYESTGGQFTVSSTVDFCEIAAACGYQHCIRADTKNSLLNALEQLKTSSGPTLIHVKVAAGSAFDLGRPVLKPYQVKDRFMQFLSQQNG